VLFGPGIAEGDIVDSVMQESKCCTLGKRTNEEIMEEENPLTRALWRSSGTHHNG